MIKITTVPASKKTDDHFILIPGGPGISSNSIRGFDLLAKKFNLHYVDFPGTNGNPYDKDRSFEELSELLLNEVKKISGNIYLVGHSYGGFFAADVALWQNVAGIVCVATPFSKMSLAGAGVNYKNKITDSLKIAEKKFEENPTDKNFSLWLSEYGGLYFAHHSLVAGRDLLLSDPSSARSFLRNTSETSKMESLLDKVSDLSMPKLFVAATDDGLLDFEVLKSDATRGKFEFIEVNNANHFVMLDQPESVASLIENFIATRERK